MGFQSVQKTPTISPSLVGHLKTADAQAFSHEEIHARGRISVALCLAARIRDCPTTSESTTSWQCTRSALITGAAGAAIDAEGAHKAIILTFQNDNLVAEYHYYSWRGGCYLRYKSGSYQAVALDACN